MRTIPRRAGLTAQRSKPHGVPRRAAPRRIRCELEPKFAPDPPRRGGGSASGVGASPGAKWAPGRGADLVPASARETVRDAGARPLRSRWRGRRARSPPHRRCAGRRRCVPPRRRASRAWVRRSAPHRCAWDGRWRGCRRRSSPARRP
ncbi:Uncharacterised protein [Mycobacteroides abscessus subsp. abscessus]|nr:Uncharacterised protein [Mycobacteroides abscessus subsp. abscessus]